ncbi:MAG: ABC transporter ATP-binding protein [Anaerolineales bacterium]|nr:ABC transporter ATP-binding protein [Anaerolineales bacterium]
MIQINHLTYTYPNQLAPALQDISWRVAAGEFVLLTGPSGSGKSTLLRCLNGLVPHFSGGKLAGQVEVAGVDVVAAGPRALSRRVGFVMQSPEAQAVLDEVTGEIVFGMEQAAVAPAEMARRLEEVLELLGLVGLQKRPLLTLSGGERQRVAIAAALALRPQLLLLDEPTSQLDPEAADELVAGLVRLRRELGLTIILAEHRLARLLPVVDRVAYMEAGQIVADGAVQEARGVGREESSAFVRVRPRPIVEEAVLDVRRMVVRYGQVEAVRGVDLTVGRGEVVAGEGGGEEFVVEGSGGVAAAGGGGGVD